MRWVASITEAFPRESDPDMRTFASIQNLSRVEQSSICACTSTGGGLSRGWCGNVQQLSVQVVPCHWQSLNAAMMLKRNMAGFLGSLDDDPSSHNIAPSHKLSLYNILHLLLAFSFYVYLLSSLQASAMLQAVHYDLVTSHQSPGSLSVHIRHIIQETLFIHYTSYIVYTHHHFDSSTEWEIGLSE